MRYDFSLFGSLRLWDFSLVLNTRWPFSVTWVLNRKGALAHFGGVYSHTGWWLRVWWFAVSWGW